MKMPKCKIELCHGKRDTRWVINEAYLDVDNERVLATNGHMAAVIPVKVTDADMSGPISDEALKMARNGVRKSATKVDIDASSPSSLVLLNGVTLPRAALGELRFPDIDKVTPPRTAMRISFNPAYLTALAHALPGAEHGITLYFQGSDDWLDPHGAIRVEPYNADAKNNGAYGILMPLRSV
jgi:DNA polymerase III sliding clamp (beta) subunit (PCNA family)